MAVTTADPAAAAGPETASYTPRVQCAYYDAGRCRSCALLESPYEAQLAAKDRRARERLGDRPDLLWLPPVASAEAGFRNKAKMVVSGTATDPVLGIFDPLGHGVDLRRCPLYPPPIHHALAVLAGFIARANLIPYDVARRRGELKYLIITASPDEQLMVRFVLRSQESVARVRKHLAWLREALPALAVASVNIQPEHKAVLEGHLEIPLTEQESLSIRLDGVTLHLRPQSFFQTNTAVAAALYRQAQTWVDDAAPRSVWDLYCGVGGFALHCASGDREVLGVEMSADAVAGARLSAHEAGLSRVRFETGDATAWALDAGTPPDLVIVNPPRRGLGPRLCDWLEACDVRHVVYSSCNAESLARDLARMPSLRPRCARLLDMFPHTWHDEVITLLERA